MCGPVRTDYFRLEIKSNFCIFFYAPIRNRMLLSVMLFRTLILSLLLVNMFPMDVQFRDHPMWTPVSVSFPSSSQTNHLRTWIT